MTGFKEFGQLSLFRVSKNFTTGVSHGRFFAATVAFADL